MSWLSGYADMSFFACVKSNNINRGYIISQDGTTAMSYKYRPAQIDDAEAISALLDVYARRNIVLSRDPDDIRRYLANFVVAQDEETGRIVGNVALRDFSDGLNEIRSLAVCEELRGQGIGTELVKAAMKLATSRNADVVFALTLCPDFFIANGFSVTDKSMFPQKVWSDCMQCPKRLNCDEVAVECRL